MSFAKVAKQGFHSPAREISTLDFEWNTFDFPRFHEPSQLQQCAAVYGSGVAQNSAGMSWEWERRSFKGAHIAEPV